MAKLNMVQSINLALHQALSADESVLLLGQDIGRNEGVFRVTAGLQKAYGERRVIDTPLAESGIIGTGIGMALAGLRPIAEMQFSGFAFLAFGQLDTHAARFRSRTQSQWSVPMVVRMPYGGGVRAHEHHSESRESTFASTPGLKVVIPSGPRNARTLLRAAIEDDDPVIFMEPKQTYRAYREEVPDKEDQWLRIGEALVDKEGANLTVVTWGAMLGMCRRVVATIESERDISIEIIDLLTISPMDSETIVRSVKKTGRCVVVQEGPRSFSVASEIVARINDEALMYLEAPVERVASYDVVTPFFQREALYMPGEARIKQSMESTLEF